MDTLYVPPAVGVPEIRPAEFTESPGTGVIVYDVGELLATIWYENAVPTRATSGAEAGVITGTPTGALIVKVTTVAAPVPAALLALIETRYVPAAVGVPEITGAAAVPVTEVPGGNAVVAMLKLIGLLLPVTG